MKTTLQNLAKRVNIIEKLLEEREKKKKKREKLIKVLSLDWKQHGWEGNPEELQDDRGEWKDAQEMIDLIKSFK